MPHRKQSFVPSAGPRSAPAFAGAIRSALRGYDGAALRADLVAGCVVGIVALPLSMALAIAVGVPPQHGLYTAIIAGVICALLGGTRFQVTGPTAAFVVILLPIVHKHGLTGLLISGAMAGVILANLVPGMERREPPSSVEEVLEWSAVPISTQEVAVLLGIDFHDAREELGRVATLRSVGADGFWTEA